MKRYCLVLLVALAAACKPELQKKYEQAAVGLNPILSELRPTMLKLRAAIAKHDPELIVEACYEDDHAYAQLKALDLDLNFDCTGDPEALCFIAFYLGQFPAWRENWCLDRTNCLRGSCTDYFGAANIEQATRSCARGCKHLLIPLIEGAEAMRQRAKAQGVEIVSLTEP